MRSCCSARLRLFQSAGLCAGTQAQALEVIAGKLARILCGDPAHPDHWQDGAGYFELALRELTQAQAPAAMPRATMPAQLGDEPLNAPAFLTEVRS